MPTIFKTDFPGVRYYESIVKDIKGKDLKKGRSGKPDKCFSIRYQHNGKRKTEVVGWFSSGIRPDYCSKLRGDILRNIKTGSGEYSSLKEKGDLEQSKKEKQENEKTLKELDRIPFHVLGDKYIEWAKLENPSCWNSDNSRYQLHLLPALGNIFLNNFNPLLMEKLKRDLSRKKLSNKKKGQSKKTLSETTVHHCLTLLRAMFNRAEGWELFYGKNPVTVTAKNSKKFLRVSDNMRKRFLDRKEATELLDHLKETNIQLHDMTILGIYAGLRAGEIFSLLWRDINFKTGVIIIKDPKNGETRAAYFNPPIRLMLDRRKKEEPNKNALVFKSTTGKKINEISNTFKKAIKDLGFNEGIEDRRDIIVFHSMRHTCGSWAAINGNTLPAIQALMGHKKIEMTMRYIHLMPSHERDAAESLAIDLGEKPRAKIANI